MNIFLQLFFIALLFLTNVNIARAETFKLSTEEFNVYKIDLSKINSYEVIEKGTLLDLALLNDIFTRNDKNGTNVNFNVVNDNNESLSASGIVINSTRGKRFAQYSLLKLSANKLNLPDGQEVYVSAYSPTLQGEHPPHASSGTFNLARKITSLAIASSPATLGISLGASFLVNGLLSAYQNGISDFFWGGLDGTGLSFLETVFRKQPDIYLNSGTIIPFVLSEDLKINKGFSKEKFEQSSLSNNDALEKIKQLIEWGDLSGALELSIKTGQKEIYDVIIAKISS